MPEDLTTLVLGIDPGGTKILTAVTNSQGKMLSRDQGITPAPKDHETVIQSILESASHCGDLKNTAARGGRVMVKE